MKPTICLTMIVKDEVPVIRRCLDSVRPFIDCWCIVDTGSTDGTPDIIRDHLRGLPGEQHHQKWVDFGFNRTQALKLARGKADYCLMIDADEVLQAGPEDFARLTADCYSIRVDLDGHVYPRAALFRRGRPWRYVGVLHEYAATEGSVDHQTLPGARIIPHPDGGRGRGLTQQQKYERDARILSKALADDPENTRYCFYLAQSYYDAGDLKKAARAYRNRVAMNGGFDEEVYYSLLRSAMISERLAIEPAMIAEAYLLAWDTRPQRAEPLVELARYYREREKHQRAFIYAQRAIDIPMPDDQLFVDSSAYQWRALDEYSIAAYWAGDYEGSLSACRRLLAEGHLPPREVDRVERNMAFSVGRVRREAA